MFAGALKTINSKYFKNIAKNTKDFAENHQLPTYHGLQTIPSENYLKLYSFQSQCINLEPQQQTPLIQVNYPTVEVQKQSRIHTIQSFHPTTIQTLTEQAVTKIQKQLIKVEINKTETLQFQANSPIQDKIVCKQLQTIDALCMSVFDGHGGSALSQFASKKINEFIDSYLSTHMNKSIKSSSQQTINVIKNSINYAYDRIQSQFFQILENQVKTGNKQIAKIGSCALTCVIYQGTIILANCGDSQGLIVKQNQQGLTCFSTNQQLNTSNANQINRIKAQFKNIDDDVLIKSKTNGKVYIKGVLQPTRTFGDYYLKNQKYFQKLKISRQSFKGPYLTHKPNFHIIPIEQNFRHLILASDGLWDFTSKKQILKVIEEHSKFISDQYIQETNDENSEELTQVELGQTYIEKVSSKSKQQKKLTQLLRDVVLDKCAKKKGKAIEGLLNVQPGERRTYCDDISIITVGFRKTHK